jgi:hypothetical protein
MFIRDSLYKILFGQDLLPLGLTSFWTGRIAKEHRSDTGTTIMTRTHFLDPPPPLPRVHLGMIHVGLR